MPTKAEMYAQMADKVATQLVGSWQEWTAFLTTAARLYKYPFHEQMMIYAQRPDATACAEYDLWNEKMGRYVRRGSKGIALVDDSGDRPRLRYVFDISDTGTREHSRTPWLWKLEERHMDSVTAMLERNYGIAGNDLPQQLTDVAGKLAGEYWEEHQQDFRYIVDGSFLEDYDELNIEVQFKAAATVSIAYALMSRCGLEPEQYFSHEDFMPIFDFNTPATIGALGTAVSQINQQVLRQIGVTIQNYEREAMQERRTHHEESHELHPERRLSDSRPEAVRAAGETPGQVRQDAESVPEGTPAHPLQSAVDEREAVPAPHRDRRDRTEPSGTADSPAGERRGRNGAAESQRPDEMGRSDEHLQGPGRGNPDGGTYQQLTLDLFLSEAEQIQKIDEAENVKTSSAFSFAQAEKALAEEDAIQAQQPDPEIWEYNGVKERHPDDLVLYQMGDFFELYGEDARIATAELDLRLGSHAIPGGGRVEMCGFPANRLEQVVEQLRDKHDVTVCAVPEGGKERQEFSMPSIDHEAEQAIDTQEAEFGADGARVFRDTETEPAKTTLRELHEQYKPIVIAAVLEDVPYRNACGHSDHENAVIEGNAAIRRSVLGSGNMELLRLYSDVPEFRQRLHREVIDETYPRLHELLRPLSQDDIDDAIRAWNGDLQSKHAVVRYMEAHAREKDTAAWLARTFDGGDGKTPFAVRPDSPEGTALPWPKVQRRIAQLIKEDRFYTQEEQDRFDNIDPIAIREALAERGIVNGQVADPEKLDNDPFIQQVMQDVETIAAEERTEPEPEPPAPDLSSQPITREGDTITIGNGESTHEIDITVSDEEYEAIQQAIPEEKVYDPSAPVYHVGDTVYLDNQEYQITELREDTVQLLPAGMAYPIFRAESRERFEQLLQNDLRNGPITEFLSADPEKTDQDLREVLTSGLFTWQDKEYISRWLRDGEGNTKIAQRLSELYSGRVETMDLVTGDIADYRTFTTSVEVEILDHEERKLATLAYRWDELAPLLRGMYVKELDGFFQDPEGFKRYAVEETSDAFEEPFIIRDQQTGRYYDLDDLYQTFETREEAEAFADRLNTPFLEGTPSYQVGDQVTLPAPDHPITGTIDAIEETTVRIYTGPYAWSYDVINREQFETWLRQDGRNAGLFTQEEKEPPAPEITSEPVTVYPGDKNGLPYDVVVERLHIDEPEPTPPEPAPPLEPAGHRGNTGQLRQDAQNFRITDDHLGEGGPRLKYQANITAIRLLKELDAAGQQASPEQQEVLSRYVGWGGVPEAFDPSKTAWAKEYAELKELLTPEEYEAARASTLNAHYTSPMVIRAIYEAVEQMGFHSGNILEPSCGVGNFFGMLPESMSESKLYGVELDSITGRIARQLYPNARIEVNGFEKTQYPDGVFDLAIGNVPFGNYRVSDRPYDRHNLLIHDYFFAKTIDKVRAGGIIAFITSNGISGGTMDKKDAHAREYMARRCDLLGAVRLPNTTFRANAGTDIAMDIVFLQKRDVPRMQGEPLPEWVETDLLHTNTYTDKDGRERHDHVTMNRYFRTHPEMVLGDLDIVTGPFGPQLVCNPREGADLEQQLREAMQHIQGRYTEAELPELGEGEDIDTSLPADPDVKNYSYTVVDGAVYYRENSRMVRPDLNATAEARVKGLVELRDCVQRLIDLEMNAAMPDAAIREQMAELNRLYDAFSAKYGLINDRANRLAFADDSSYYLLCALEVLDEDGRLERKADMFTKRTIKPHEAVASVDTAAEALAVSISEKACVDMAYMEQLTGRTGDELAEELRGVIFQVPGITEPDGTPHYVTADEYLSGNVRQKLRQAQRAAERDPAFSINVEALTTAQPKDLDASEIEVRLGATWIDKEYIQQFMYETFKTPPYLRDVIEVKYVPYTAEWQVTGKNSVGYNNVAAYTTYGTNRANAYKILEDSLNLRDVRIYDTVEDADGKERRVLNAKETTLAAQKQQAIREAFKDWIWKDPERRQALVRQYNEEMNSTRPREYDGSHIVFGGMNPSITLREHQKNAIAHVLYGGNTLLAHEVGAGKTFEMVAAAMEAKRLGLCQKSLFVVPNHLTEQWASEFLRLYPSANILVTTKKDFEKHNRKKFCARIATGDYDAIIIGHSQFERIPISKERQERLLREQIWEITEGISEVESSGGERFTVKQLERTKKSLEARLEKLQAEGRKDDVVTFEQLGVDRLFVDEAHNYKNLFLYTKMRNVAGLSTTDAQKSSDMFAKCRYMDEITGGRGVVFATGTPVSNSMTVRP